MARESALRVFPKFMGVLDFIYIEFLFVSSSLELGEAECQANELFYVCFFIWFLIGFPLYIRDSRIFFLDYLTIYS